MLERLKAPISVYSFYNHRQKVFYPGVLVWEGRKYKTTRVGYHHTFRQGKTLFHVFSLETPELSFRLVHNTDNLSWEVQEISDGQVD